jgi:hypothetical protein
MLVQTYGSITKKSLLNQVNMVKERFNNANFKSKRSGGKQIINRVEVVDHGTAVYFWYGRMNNFVVYGGSKKGTYNKLCGMLLHICFEENKDYISLSDFIIKK